jgi:ribonuclease HII
MISNPDLNLEKRFWRAGYKYVAGLDEAGRGALAGPVAAAAVILPHEARLTRMLKGARDSKQMTSSERERLAPGIKEHALSWGIGFASAAEIDALGIVASTRLAALRAVERLSVFPDFLLTDFRLELPELDLPQVSLVKGDQLCLSVAAASILAKTARDQLMRETGVQFAQYGFSKHKGYGTREHREAIERFGRSPEHRKTFSIKKTET